VTVPVKIEVVLSYVKIAFPVAVELFGGVSDAPFKLASKVTLVVFAFVLTMIVLLFVHELIPKAIINNSRKLNDFVFILNRFLQILVIYTHRLKLHYQLMPDDGLKYTFGTCHCFIIYV